MRKPDVWNAPKPRNFCSVNNWRQEGGAVSIAGLRVSEVGRSLNYPDRGGPARAVIMPLSLLRFSSILLRQAKPS